MLTKTEMNLSTPYRKIKNWYIENMHELPFTLDGPGKYYGDVKWTAELYMNQIEQELLKHGKYIKKSAIAGAAKSNLVTMWRDLQDESAWNLPMATTIEEKTKRINDRAKR